MNAAPNISIYNFYAPSKALQFEFANGTGSIAPTIGDVSSTTDVILTSNLADTDYVLTVTNAEGATATSTVNVKAFPEITAFAYASPDLSFTFANGTAVVSDGIATSTVVTSGGSLTLTANGDYTLVVTNVDGVIASSSAITVTDLTAAV